LQDKSEWVRSSAAASLGQLGQGNDALLSALQDESEYVRRDAAASLGQLGQGNDKVMDALLSTLQDKDKYVRGEAATSLGQLGQGNDKVIDALLLALQDKDEWVRGKAAASLGQLGQGNDKVMDALLSALQDKDRSVRSHAATSLTQLEHSSEVVIDALLGGIEIWNSEQIAESLAKQLKLLGVEYENNVLITLNQDLHDFWKRDGAIEVLRRVMDGKPLPGYRWRSLAWRQQRWEWLKGFMTQKPVLRLIFGMILLGFINLLGLDHWLIQALIAVATILSIL